MPKLVLSMDGLVLKEIPLAKERLTIGRKAHNDVQIDNLAISGEHAAITTILEDSFVEDLNSTNGTFVNGQPVKKTVLRANDVIELGKYRVKYIVEPKVESVQGADRALEYDPTASSPQPAPPPDPAVTNTRPVSEQTGATHAPTGIIRVLSGANAGKQMELTKTLTTLGRQGQQVAVISRRPQGYTLTHVEGEQFPLVNGRAIDAQPRALADRDVIELAGVRMEFQLKQ